MNSSFTTFRRSLTFVLASVLLLWQATCVASPGQSFTIHLSNVTETVSVTNPCFGPAVGVLTYDAVIHVTVNATSYHTVAHFKGDALTDPEDPNEPQFYGAFSETQVLNINRKNTVTAIAITQLADHGVKFHITFHLTLTDSGGGVSVFNYTCVS